MFTYYIIKRGDTLADIAQKFETSVSTLQKLNRIQNIDEIYAGDRLIVPITNWNRPQWWEDGMIIFPLPPRDVLDGLYDGQYPEDNMSQTRPQCTPYTVEAGDTLNSIARRKGTTVNILRHLNDQDSLTNLQAGSVICVPKTENSYVYSVRPGDNIYKIAQRFSVDPNLLMSINYIQPDQVILPGMQLVIPFS